MAHCKYKNGTHCECDSLKKEYYPSGELKSEIPLVDGKPHGIVYVYHTNGDVLGKTEMFNGKSKMEAPIEEVPLSLRTKIILWTASLLGPVILLGIGWAAPIITIMLMLGAHRYIPEPKTSNNEISGRAGALIIIFLIGFTVSVSVVAVEGIDQPSINVGSWQPSVAIFQKPDTLLVTDVRVSCDSIQKDSTVTYITHSTLTRTRVALTGITQNPFIYEEMVGDQPITIKKHQGLPYREYSELAQCNDTTMVVDRVPYSDRVFSAMRITKTYVSHSTWSQETQVSYKNLSSQVSEWDIRKLLNQDKSFFRHTVTRDRYIRVSPESTDTTRYPTKEAATTVIETYCKDKSTVVGKFLYTEYDACIRNNKVKSITIDTVVSCGSAKPYLSYERGALASTPMWCNYDATWTWSNTEEEI